MKKKIKSIVASILVIGSFMGASSLNAFAATKTVKASGKVSSEFFATTKPIVYLYTYNSAGNFVAKYPVTSEFSWPGKYKFSLGSTKIDDTKVSKVCLQVKMDGFMSNGPTNRYSSRVNLKSGTYSISIDSSGNVILK
jgi:hypothetical protein